MTTEKVAVVTGAGSGLGRIITIALADKGWYVAAAGRRFEPLEETAALARPELVLPVQADVGDPDSVAALFAIVARALRPARPAGQQRRHRRAARRGGRDHPRGLAVDRGRQPHRLVPVRASRGAMMKAQQPMGGRIINNGSISAHAPRPRSVGYTVTKHAITGLTKSISLDGRPYNIACGQIDIGNANTAMTEQIAAGAPQADGSVKAEPTFDPRLAADAVVFMAELPLDANVQFMTITATTMPFIGRG